MVLPDWLAVTVQLPPPAMVRVEPASVQTLDGLAIKLTGRPELAVTERVMGDAPYVTGARAAKLMVWDALLTVRVCETGVAAAYVVLPAWLAVTTQDPAPAMARDEPDREHTVDGLALKLTGSPELADAERVIGAAP